MQFSHGKSYSAEFAVNLLRVIGRIEEVGGLVTRGRDDICAACPNPIAHETCSIAKVGDVGIKQLDEVALQLLGMHIGDHIAPGILKDRVSAAAREWQTVACAGCEWRDTCAPMIKLAALPA